MILQKLLISIFVLSSGVSAWAGNLPTIQQHPPFAKNQCFICHTKDADGKPVPDGFIAAQPDLCYMCHQKKDRGAVVHPALTMVDCTMCHSPHESMVKPLMKDKIGNVCTMCHDAPGMDQPVKHSALIMLKSCVRCHSPHSSDNEKLLKAETPQLCTYCHTDIGKGLNLDSNTIHPAVLMGCQNCHAPHGGGNDKLLKDVPNSLCFTCHDKAPFDGGHPRAGHPTSGKQDPIYKERELSCISCHKPHFSRNEHLLRYNFKVAPYNGTICSVCHWNQIIGPPGPPKPGWND